MENRNYNIDLMKIMACLAVVGAHTFTPAINGVNHVFYCLCIFCIPVFFMANGYFVLSKKRTWKYFGLKILKILKVTIIWNLIIFLVYIILEQKIINLPLYVLKSLFTMEGYLGHFWFLGALLILYLLALPLQLLLEKVGYRFVFVFLAVICIVIELFSFFKGAPVQANIKQSFRIWTWLFYFVAGAKMREISKFIEEHIPVAFHMTLSCLWSVLIVVYQYFMGKYILNTIDFEYFYDSIIVMIWCIMIFSLVTRIHLNEKCNRLIMKISPLTMGIFIIHRLLVVGIKHFWQVESSGDALLFFVVVTAFSGLIVFVCNTNRITRQLISL